MTFAVFAMFSNEKLTTCAIIFSKLIPNYLAFDFQSIKNIKNPTYLMQQILIEVSAGNSRDICQLNQQNPKYLVLVSFQT